MTEAQVWIGGSLGYNHAEIGYGEHLGIDFGNATTDLFTFAPEIGYTLNERFAVALAVGYSHDDGSSNQWSFNPYVRYHFAESGPIRFFLDGGLIYSHGHLNGLSTDISFFPDQLA